MRHDLSTVSERFWRYVDRAAPTSCWRWVGAGSSGGYGRLWDSRVGRAVFAHRLSYEIHFFTPPRDKEVCHRCDNKLCVNPAHLFLGTHQDNMRDLKAKDRNPHGETHPKAVLSDSLVLEIRRLVASGTSARSLALRLGLHPTHVSQVASGRLWPHVGGSPLRSDARTFIKERCVFGAHLSARVTVLHQAYREWSSARGKPPVSKLVLSVLLRGRGLTQRQRYGGFKVWCGVGLR